MTVKRKCRKYELYEYGTGKHGLIIYDSKLASRINRVVGEWPKGTSFADSEPLFVVGDHQLKPVLKVLGVA